jgi:hypothetical protein
MFWFATLTKLQTTDNQWDAEVERQEMRVQYSESDSAI